MPPVDVPGEAVQAMLARWFPGGSVSCTRMGAGVSTPVYRVMVDGAESYLRLAEQPGERRDAEARAHELALERGVAVPGILRWEREPPELDRSALLTSAVPGVPLLEYAGDPDPALRRAGLHLARLNAIPVRGYGWAVRVEGDDRHLVAEHPTRAAWVAEYLAAAHTVIHAGVLPGTLHDPLKRAIGAWATWPGDGPSCLAHGDFDPSHIYVTPEDGSYQGLIDLGEIRGADRAYDLGHLLVHAGPAACDAACAGYAEVAQVDRDAIRLQAIAIVTRRTAIQLGRAPHGYRNLLIARLVELLGSGH